MTTPTVHADLSHPGTLYLDAHDAEGTRFYLSRHDARQLGQALLAATDPADDDPMRWTSRVEQDEAGNVVTTPPPPDGWPGASRGMITLTGAAVQPVNPAIARAAYELGVRQGRHSAGH
jgi:hypothetical protein